jgi:hypothetical protein
VLKAVSKAEKWAGPKAEMRVAHSAAEKAARKVD